ncbi:MAG: hypothetical protein IKU07_01785 [Oscillospiraceae bacterium]|nr:hypothetical protein [Oscillospiraceae bacterium]
MYTNLFPFIRNAVQTCTCSASPKDTHGPVVKTGPTAGQNRSRNQNGQWRKKRSDAGKSRG